MSDENNELARLSAIHAASNACARYRREAAGRDVWQTPTELAASGVGDCEDFAIDAMFRVIKFHYVARLGCCRRSDDQLHMVCLAYSPGTTADPWVLDVVADAVCRLSERQDLELIYELGLAGIYVDGDIVGGIGHNAKWKDVIDLLTNPRTPPLAR